MRIYYTTYFFQGSIQPDERYPTPFVVDGIVRFYYSILEKMLTMYPVLDADETERGMIDRIEFLRFAKNKSMPFKETDMDLYVYEFMGGSHGPGS